ncbi:ergothioneine biosynthesis protein EgtB [Methylomicrobium album]|uniref:TIGR03440 family protein n=1 Tax=Methylomicrobium album BG8 TaxID=686340 RepID=H8GHP4_METAL|nr:ergothioneine biosynthesis protein EgtB [Methylomicrobium album]EIC31362.1 TIGR03440 family protein [Methylomicrobium album BG8]
MGENSESVSGQLEAYCRVRRQSEMLCKPLTVEDYVVQTMPDVSPPKWHLAHASWFFETFILVPYVSGYRPFDVRFHPLFNSYYQGVGTPFPRDRRGLLSRPSVVDIYRYRRHVDEAMTELMERLDDRAENRDIHLLIELGLHHEQQHQELLLTDIKHILGNNPLVPVYAEDRFAEEEEVPVPLRWIKVQGGETAVGHDGNGFCFDNELPRHRMRMNEFLLANRLVTNVEYLEFIDDGGYANPLLWLADGWASVQREGWQAPLYWRKMDGAWRYFTLAGEEPLTAEEPVCHVSYFEADAFATWAGKRLPSEEEWEHAAGTAGLWPGNYLESGRFRPQAALTGEGVLQLGGDVWEWTQSAYRPYPGFRPWANAVGEYNGKFMCSQMVLRGGSCATPESHIRKSYRNFFYPHNRWQFMGIRLAQDT